jgi:hypothetical protein
MRRSKLFMPPDTVVTRLDGWFGSADVIPPGLAEAIASAMPQPGGDTVADIRARMIARQNMYTRSVMRRRKFEHILKRVP